MRRRKFVNIRFEEKYGPYFNFLFKSIAMARKSLRILDEVYVCIFDNIDTAIHENIMFVCLAQKTFVYIFYVPNKTFRNFISIIKRHNFHDILMKIVTNLRMCSYVVGKL